MTDQNSDIYGTASFLWPLARLSARLGRSLTDVQGPGGNTSIKRDGVLWVKGSGLNLSDVDLQPGFVPVNLYAARAVIDSGSDAPIARLDDPLAKGLRPSIETSLHALMPHACVAHTHQVDAIAWAVRADAAETLAEPLAGLDWAFVPYARPGLPLSGSVRDLLQRRRADILILGNHGLVVGGDDPLDVERRLDEVRRRLALKPRNGAVQADSENLARLAEGTDYRPCSRQEAHITAFDDAALSIAGRGVLYPDHVVFLGTTTTIVPPGAETLPPVRDCRLVICAGSGALVRRDCSPAADAMAACLGLVTSRIDPATQLRYLSDEDIAALIGWDAEKHRQQMAAQH